MKHYDLPANPQVPADLGMMHDLIRAMPGVAITAAMVGMAMSKLREVRESENA